MTGVIIGASLLLAHVTGFIELVAPPLGAVGTAVLGIDHTVAGAVDLNNYVKGHKSKKNHP